MNDMLAKLYAGNVHLASKDIAFENLQLLFTTHDVLLMDQDLLRRDQMWVAERNASSSSTLIAFGEYRDVRYDRDIRELRREILGLS